jgi:hypothetical protein
MEKHDWGTVSDRPVKDFGVAALDALGGDGRHAGD